MSQIKTRISGLGIYLPEQIITNKDLEKTLDTSDEWIFERTGIRARHRCSTTGGEFPSDMALKASQEALKQAKLNPNDIDFILFCYVTPDYKVPNTASILQSKLGITNKCPCLDLSAACSGHVYAMSLANSLLKTGIAKNILIASAEMLSREVDWEDRSICILFGDGCGVFILSAHTDPNSKADIHASHLETDSNGSEFFNHYIGGAVTPLTQEHLLARNHFMQMKGKEMFKVATRTLASNALKALEKANLSIEEVDWVIPHQANSRIIETTGKLLGLSPEKIIDRICYTGNTSAASIPLAFHAAIEEGLIKRGQTILFDAFGAGLTSGALVFTY